MADIKTIPCKACGANMKLVGVLPRVGSLPELRTFRCHACGNVRTIEQEGKS